MASKISSNPKSPFFVNSCSNKSAKTGDPASISFSFLVARRINSKHSLWSVCRYWRIRAIYTSPRKEESLYKLLGISETESSLSNMKKAYKKMARIYHSDVSPPDRLEENTKRFVMVKEVYETLSNPQQRALFDQDLGDGSPYSGFYPENTVK